MKYLEWVTRIALIGLISYYIIDMIRHGDWWWLAGMITIMVILTLIFEVMLFRHPDKVDKPS